MRFNLPSPAPTPDLDTTLRVGNVYMCKGGGKTRYWIVIGLDDVTVNLLGVNTDGVVTSTANYGVHVFDGRSSLFKRRELVGRCTGLDNLEFDIEWVQE